jgi:Na+-driven multidrug efflux pump
MSAKTKKKEPVCAICRQIRYFLMVGIPLLVLIGTRTDLEPPAIPLHEIVANFIVIALVIVVFWKVWEARQDKKSVSKDSSEEKL